MAGKITFDTGSIDDFALTSEKIRTVNILVAGLTGSGKSSIIRAICAGDSPMVKMSVNSVTKNLTMYGNNLMANPDQNKKNEKYMVNLFDTVGLGDNQVTVPTILRQIVECMPKHLSSVHKVIFCFKMDRLRAKMSEELNILFNFFKMLGAKPKNFVICLTFCDTLNDDTIGRFWDELKSFSDLEMMKEDITVTYTSFPNIEECDNDPRLIQYLEDKTRRSQRRIWKAVIEQPAEEFFPHDTMIRMPQLAFDDLCRKLQDYTKRSKWWFSIFNKTEQEDIMEQMKKLRSPQFIETGEKLKNKILLPKNKV